MALKISIAPAKEPITLDEAKLHLRITEEDEDTLIQSLIAAARQDCEKFQNRAYITQVWELWLDAWPGKDFIEIPLPPLQVPVVIAGAFVTGTAYRILSVGTTNFIAIGASANTVGIVFTATGAGSGTGTVTSSGVIKYYGTDDTEYSMTGTDYFVDTKSEPGRISLASDKSWPDTTLRPINGICITFVAGYGEAESVPQNIKNAILLLIGHLYEHREDVITGISAMPMPQGSEALLWKDRCF
jgi:hypothetical protein